MLIYRFPRLPGLAAVCLAVAMQTALTATAVETVTSPDGNIRVDFQLTDRGEPTLAVRFKDAAVASGKLGLEFLDSGQLSDQLQLVDAQQSVHQQTYSIPVGKTSTATDHYHQLSVTLQESKALKRKLNVVLRAFNDGIAVRYQLPEQPAFSDFALTAEHTQLSFDPAALTRSLPLGSFTTSYEDFYQTRRTRELGDDQLLGLPLLLHHPQDFYVAVTEAGLTDYAGMYLTGVAEQPGTLISKLSPLPGRSDGACVTGQAPFQTPWRVLMIADEPGRLLESDLVFNLNEPSRIQDPSWIKPGQTSFSWWNHYVVGDVDFEPGVNTATMKHYIDFCAEYGIPYHTLDGLDIAWYGGPIQPSGPTDVTRAADSIDMPELLRYADERGVRLRLWMHWKALEPQLEEAFATYERWGIEGVMIDFMDRDDQQMVQWYHKVAETAARHHLTVTWHGAYKPTGMERTWPNVLSYEAVLNQEFNKWTDRPHGATTPQHNLDVALIRNLAGPLDYHQGGMRNVLPQNFQTRNAAPFVPGTRGHQLAMYVVYQNHLPMLVDYPASYRQQPDLPFLVSIPANWDETRVLHAEPGRCAVIARRHGDTWYLGGMTADAPQTLELSLNFLADGRYTAELYLDDPAAGPTKLKHQTQPVSAGQTLSVSMPAAGGFAGKLTQD